MSQTPHLKTLMGNWLYLNVSVIILIVQVPVNLVHIGRESLLFPPIACSKESFLPSVQDRPCLRLIYQIKKPPAFSFHITSWGSAEYRFQVYIKIPFLSLLLCFMIYNIYYRNTCLCKKRDRREEKSKIFRVTVTPGLAKMVKILLYCLPELSLMQLEYNCDNNNTTLPLILTTPDLELPLYQILF